MTGGGTRPPAQQRTRNGDDVPDRTMAELWQATLEALDEDGLQAQQRAFLTLARLVGLLDDTALIAVPNDFTKDQVETSASRSATR